MNLSQKLPDRDIAVDAILLPIHGTTVTAEELKVRLVLAADFADAVTVDASDVESVGQAVLQLLIAAHADAKAAGRRFAIIDPSPSFTARLTALGLAELLSPVEGEEFL